MEDTVQVLVKQVFQCLKKKNQTICVAESCTGGLISHCFTNIQGSSDFFNGGFVSYTYSSKINVLKIPEDLLKTKGAVNEEVAMLMTVGVKSLLKGDWSLSITGYMDVGQEPGKIFVGVIGPEVQDVATTVVEGSSRIDLKYQSLLFSLNFLLSKLVNN